MTEPCPLPALPQHPLLLLLQRVSAACGDQYALAHLFSPRGAASASVSQVPRPRTGSPVLGLGVSPFWLYLLPQFSWEPTSLPTTALLGRRFSPGWPTHGTRQRAPGPKDPTRGRISGSLAWFSPVGAPRYPKASPTPTCLLIRDATALSCLLPPDGLEMGWGADSRERPSPPPQASCQL